MAGRIALMIKGLPSIPVDEAVDRFKKYYPTIADDTFHKSQSFTGRVINNDVSFVNPLGTLGGGSGITKQTMGDLRQLRKDFDEYSYQNPGIYTNDPTTASREKLYKRVGWQGSPDSGRQVFDSRRIARDDEAYVKAIDNSILPKDIASIVSPEGGKLFLQKGSEIVDATLARNKVNSAMTGVPYRSFNGTSIPTFDEIFETVLAYSKKNS